MKPGYSFNAKYVKGITKTKFLKDFSKVYPHLDLSGIYDKIVGGSKRKRNPSGE